MRRTPSRLPPIVAENLRDQLSGYSGAPAAAGTTGSISTIWEVNSA